MSSLHKLKELQISLARMLQAAAKRDGLDESQALVKIGELFTSLSSFAATLPEDELSGLKLYKEYIGEEMWKVMGTNPAISDLARAHVKSLLQPKLDEAFVTVQTWVNDTEFTVDHFNLFFEV